MEPKSIAFYTAVAVSILAVLSATTFPTLVQAQQQQQSEQPQEQTTQADNDAAIDETDTEESNEAMTGRTEPQEEPKEETQEETQEEENSNSANSNDDDGAASQSLGLESGGSGVASCGQVITADTVLTSDLECSNGDGLVVAASDITIDLNGYSITSGEEADGSEDPATDYDGDTGIMVANADNVAIHGLGEIAGFSRGVTFLGSSGGEVTDVQFSDNGVGVVASNSEGIEISRNTLTNNGIGAILDATNRAIVAFNQFVANLEEGIVLEGSSDNVIAANNLFGNGFDGIYLDEMSERNNVDYNTAFGHETADMNNADGMPTNVNENIFGDNNNCGTSLPGGLCR
jgi:parallel beta-helix repeat protein